MDREKYLERHRRYNNSAKGYLRSCRYEIKRKRRWAEDWLFREDERSRARGYYWRTRCGIED